MVAVPVIVVIVSVKVVTPVKSSLVAAAAIPSVMFAVDN